jgi:hypothetical protein
VLLVVLAAGCSSLTEGKQGERGDQTSAASRAGGARAARAQGTATPVNMFQPVPVLTMDVYLMSVPSGAISRSSEFWKRVDEQRVDPASYDLLLKNGIRVGIGPNSDWEFFRGILEQNRALTTKGTATSGGTGSVELTMKKNVPWEDIFYLNDQDKLYGRTYEKCENLLGISFWPEPRKPGSVRISISPTVRSLRTRLQYTVRDEEREITDVQPEYLYDLNLRAVIPPDSFLVIAPSLQGKWPTSIGNAFLVSDRDAEQYEQVLVMVPRTVMVLRAPGPIMHRQGG